MQVLSMSMSAWSSHLVPCILSVAVSCRRMVLPTLLLLMLVLLLLLLLELLHLLLLKLLLEEKLLAVQLGSCEPRLLLPQHDGAVRAGRAVCP